MSAIAEHAGGGPREPLQAAGAGCQARYETMLKVLHSLGVTLTVSVGHAIRQTYHSLID